MSSLELRADLHQLIDQLDDRILRVVHAAIVAYKESDGDEPVLGYQTDGKEITATLFLEQAEAAIAEAKAGTGISVEELEKRSEQWLTRIM